MLEELYKQHILDHYARPHNKGVLEDPTHAAHGSNPSCGDALALYLKVEDDTITQAKFEGTGCAISQAAASMLTDKLTGMSLSAVQTLSEGDILTMLGIEITLARRKCALLAYNALKEALLLETRNTNI
jgi:nitrogen fixation NifU-like protein